MRMPGAAVQPSLLIDAYSRNRARTRALFDLVSHAAYYSRPIDLRHPIVFYEGHLPAFSFNTLVKRALGGASIDARLERLFARGIDPPGPTRQPYTASSGRRATRCNNSPPRRIAACRMR
jgi:hypothetical protein